MELICQQNIKYKKYTLSYFSVLKFDLEILNKFEIFNKFEILNMFFNNSPTGLEINIARSNLQNFIIQNF